MKEKGLFTTKNIALMGMLGGLGGVLMLFEVPLLLIAPEFYKLDLGELPVLIGAFTLGPVAGIVIEFVKIIVKLLLKSTTTGFVGDFANFVIGCSLIIPAAIIYRFNRSKKGAVIGMIVGTMSITVVGAVINALVMLPFYSNLIPLENILEKGAAVNPAVGSVWTFVLFCVAPFNLIKGVVVSLLTLLLYKRVSVLIHSAGKGR